MTSEETPGTPRPAPIEKLELKCRVGPEYWEPPQSLTDLTPQVQNRVFPIVCQLRLQPIVTPSALITLQTLVYHNLMRKLFHYPIHHQGHKIPWLCLGARGSWPKLPPQPLCVPYSDIRVCYCQSRWPLTPFDFGISPRGAWSPGIGFGWCRGS